MDQVQGARTSADEDVRVDQAGLLTAGAFAGGSGGRVADRFAVGAGRVAAVLRLPVVAMMSLVGGFVPEPQASPGLFRAVLLLYAVWALAVVWWVFRRPVPGWLSWLTTGVDLAVLVVLAAASNGATSQLQPFFYLFPIGVAIHCRPALTATVGAVMAGGYAAVWLSNLGEDGGPGLPAVVWLHFGMLLWLAVATTAVTAVLVRRSAGVLNLLAVQRQLTAESLAGQERQRARVAEDLHDGPLQNLIAARRNLEELGDLLPGNHLLDQTDTLLRDTAMSLRGTVTVLHPQVLAQLGLAPALAELIARQLDRRRITVHTNLADVGRPPSQDLLYSTARELLSNVVRHAGAANVWIDLTHDDGWLSLTVTDDGFGLEPDVLSERLANGHIGLAAHALRTAELGGQLRVEAREPHGTTVHVAIPDDDAHAGATPPGAGSAGRESTRRQRTAGAVAASNGPEQVTLPADSAHHRRVGRRADRGPAPPIGGQEFTP